MNAVSEKTSAKYRFTVFRRGFYYFSEFINIS